MKKIIIAFLLLCSLVSFSQTPPGYTKISAKYSWIAGKFDSTLTIPFGTTPGFMGGYSHSAALYYNVTDSSLYASSPTLTFRKIGDNSSKLNISDTAAMLTPYLRKADSSIYYPYRTNPLGYLTAATVPIPTLQQVTDADNFTTNPIHIYDAGSGDDGIVMQPVTSGGHNWGEIIVNEDGNQVAGMDNSGSVLGEFKSLRWPHSVSTGGGQNGGIILTADTTSQATDNVRLKKYASGNYVVAYNPKDSTASPRNMVYLGADSLFHLAAVPGGSSLTGSQGDMIYFSATNTVANLAKNTSSHRYISNGGTSNNPAWAQIDLTDGVTGVLPIANGGTGSSSKNFVDLTTGQTVAGSKVFSTNPTLSSLTSGSVVITGTGGLISQDNSNFFWDATNHRLGIGTTTPATKLEIQNSTGSAVSFYLGNGNIGDNAIDLGYLQSTNNAAEMYFRYAGLGSSSNQFNLGFTGTSLFNISMLASGLNGINKAAPTEALDVFGNFRLSSAFMPNNLPGAVGEVLLSTGAGTAPVWKKPYGVVAQNDQAGVTATLTLTTYTTPNNGTTQVYDVSAHVVITAVSAGVLTTTVTYTDETNTSRTVTLYGMGTTTAGLSATGASNFSVMGEIMVYPNTTITVTSTLTIGTMTYDAGATIRYVRQGYTF